MGSKKLAIQSVSVLWSHPMISDREMWTAANMMLVRHGEAAADAIAARIDSLLAAKDDQGAEVWSEILVRLGELQRERRRPGERLQ